MVRMNESILTMESSYDGTGTGIDSTIYDASSQSLQYYSTLLSSLNVLPVPAHKEKRDPLAREEEDRRAGEGNDTTIDVDASMSDIPTVEKSNSIRPVRH